MSNSETSPNNTILYQNAQGDKILSNKKNTTTDTDIYLNMIANPNKITLNKEHVSESSNYDNLINSDEDTSLSDKSKRSNKSDKTKSDAKPIFEKISVQFNKSNNENYSEKINRNEKVNSPNSDHMLKEDNYKKKEEKLSPVEIKIKKINLLSKLAQLKSKGLKPTKDYDFTSSIEEMEYEYEVLKNFATKKKGVEMYKTFLTFGINCIEWCNSKYDPFDFQLDGWGEQVEKDIHTWDDTLEDLHEKYKSSGREMLPEVKLLFLIAGSAVLYHKTKSLSPNLRDTLLAHPELLSNLVNSKKEESKFMTEQEINIMKQKEELNKREKELKEMANNMKKNYNDPMPANFKMPINQDNSMGINSRMNQKESINQQNVSCPITVPLNVKNILNNIKNKVIEESNINHNNDTQDELSSNNDRLVSETTISENNTRKKNVKKPKKTGLSIF
jgi:hypothetical protein